MKFYPTPAIILGICAISLSACNKPVVEHHHEHQEIVVTSPEDKSVTLTEQYVCQIHSRRHIEVRALEGGYLEKIPVAEGQVVKQGDSMFKIVPTLYQARLDSAAAEAKLARVEYDNTKRLFEQNVVSDKEVMLAEAKLAKARAAVQLAEARLNFTDVKAPFDGIIDRLHEQQGSLIEEGDILTTLSDNDVMWVYFNVPEARYLEYKAGLHQVVQTTNPAAQAEADVDGGDPNELEIELVLANGNKFGEHCLPRRFPESERLVAPRPDRHRADPSPAQRCAGHSAAGDVRNPRQTLRLRHRQGRRSAATRDRCRPRNGRYFRH
jgi:membrane fusion protein, multidrug efflux system